MGECGGATPHSQPPRQLILLHQVHKCQVYSPPTVTYQTPTATHFYAFTLGKGRTACRLAYSHVQPIEMWTWVPLNTGDFRKFCRSMKGRFGKKKKHGLDLQIYILQSHWDSLSRKSHAIKSFSKTSFLWLQHVTETYANYTHLTCMVSHSSLNLTNPPFHTEVTMFTLCADDWNWLSTLFFCPMHMELIPCETNCCHSWHGNTVIASLYLWYTCIPDCQAHLYVYLFHARAFV